ncbi:MAG: aldehyde dehydrogenase [Gammaproteobacteria bacterium]
MASRLVRLALLPGIIPLAALAQELPWESLPEGEGRKETYAMCTPCHSIMLVEQQGMTRDHWDDTLDWMIEEQGMAELDPSLRELILDYLAAAFPPERPHYRGQTDHETEN